ncbi:uncharacterized protein LOC141857948 [Brevipalpus obovatus]|uniref:uncharacterized protein LOC141857948 n=1 Tax=Brevipalpus obovatus TaxID=246614 RepID=UPI003D9E091F
MWIHLAIWYSTCLVLTLGQTSGDTERKLENTIDRLCSEKSLMLKRGLSEEMASRIMGKKIEKFTGLMRRGSYPEYIQPIAVNRKTVVGPYGHSMNLNFVGIQESTVENTKIILLDQINNDFEESDVNEFEFDSRPTNNLGRSITGRGGLASKSSVELKCEKQVRNEIQKALTKAGHLDTKKLETKRKPSSIKDLTRQSMSGVQNPAQILVKEKTAIGAHGYDINLDQIASGGSTNTMMSTILDQQEHSKYNKAKVVSIYLEATPDLAAGRR